MKIFENKIKNTLSKFDPISLENLNNLKLMKRKDKKHVFNLNKLNELLNKVVNEYKVLEIDSERIFEYQTDYFDTPNLVTYLNHHNNRLNRYKIRQRHYEINDKNFLEIKTKNNKKQTIKKRIESEKLDFVNDKSFNFIKSNISIEDNNLTNTLSNSFKRITLASYETKERITIDYKLQLWVNNNSIHLDNITIAELKCEKESSRSPFSNALKELKIYPRGFSKYCIGTALLRPNVKKNAFKEDLMFINKL
jgi:hypothetical protein